MVTVLKKKKSFNKTSLSFWQLPSMQAKFSHQRSRAIRSNNYFNKRYNLQWVTGARRKLKLSNWKMLFWMARWQFKPRELYFSHGLPDAISGLPQKTDALFVTVILGLFPCCVLTLPLPRCHHVVFVTCTGSNHHQVNRVGAQRDVASGFGIINLTHHVIIISHCHLEKGLLKVIGQTVNSTTDDK